MRSLMPVLLVLVGVFSVAYTNIRTPHIANAATANTVNFQARLQTAGGAIVPDGDYNVEFKLYDALTSGNLLWTETRTGGDKVQVKNGYLTVNLGSVTAFGSMNWDQKMWLTMNIGGTGSASWDGEMSPRLALTAVPYAFSAGQLQTTSGANTSTLSIQAPTNGSQLFQIPDQGAAGTYNLCIQNSSSCGFAAAAGAGNYIQNQSASTQTADFKISGTGFAGTLQGGQLKGGSSQQFTVDTNGNVAFDGSANHTISVSAPASAGTGKTLTVSAGDATASGAAPSIVGNNITFVNNTNSVTVNYPSGLAVGDTLVLFAGHGYSINAPTGFTSVATANGGANASGVMYTKTVVSGDIGGSINVTFTGSYYGEVAIVAARNVSGVRNNVSSQSGAGTTSEAIGPLTVTAGDLVFYGGFVRLTNGAITLSRGTTLTTRSADTAAGAVTGYEIAPSTGTITQTYSVNSTPGGRYYGMISFIPTNTPYSGGNLTLSGGAGASSVTGGGVVVKNPSNTTTAFSVQNASGTSILSVDTVNGRIGVNNTSPSYAIDVTGSVSASTSLLAPLLDTATATALNIGTTNATGINLNQNTTIAAGKNFTFTSGAGNFDQSASSGTFKTGTGAVSLNGNTTIASDKSFNALGISTFQSATNSSNAFMVKSSDGTNVLNVDTTHNWVGINTASPNAAFEVNGTAPAYYTGFEAGTMGDFSTTNSAKWAVDTSSPYAGSYQLHGTNTAGTQGVGYETSVTKTLTASGTVSFYVNCGWMYATSFTFQIDSGTSNSLTGSGCNLFGLTSTWTYYSFPVTSGTHTFKWSFSQGGGATGAVSVAIDNVNITNAGATSTSALFNSGYVGMGLGAGVMPTAQLDVKGAIQGSSSLALGTSSTTNGTIEFKNSTNANTVTMLSGAQTGNYTLTIPVLSANDTICTVGLANCGSSGSFVNLQGSTPGTPQTGNINVSGTVIAGTTLLSPALDAASSGALTIGGTNATSISLQDDTVLAAGKSITITGSGTRPSSPSEGMLYYDTTTKQLLTYANGKWQADRSEAVLVAASDSSAADKAAADYVADGNTGTAADGDQVEINSALTAASGKKVVLLAGTYTVDAAISVPNNTTLAGVGAGTLITIPNSLTGVMSIIQNTDTSTGTGIVVRDLRLDGNRANISSGSKNGVMFTNVGDTTSPRSGGMIQNLWVNNFNNAAVSLISSDNSVVSGVIAYNSDYGVDVESSYNVSVTGSSTNGGLHGIYVYGGGDNAITGNATNGATNEGIMVNAAPRTTVSGNSASNNTDTGIYVYSASNAAVSGNTVSGNGAKGLRMEWSDGNSINANRFVDNGGATTNESIYIYETDNSQISGNKVTDSSATTNSYSINIDGSGSANTYLSDNTLGTGSIRDTGTGTIFGGQVNSSGNYVIQPAGTIELNKNTSIANALTVGTSSSTDGTIVFKNGTNGNAVTIKSGAQTGNYTLTIPVLSANDTICTVGLANCGGGSGVTTVGTFSNTSIANGASISGTTITFGAADATNPGMVSTGTQTFGGAKTFQSTSTTAFQVQAAGGSSTILAVDTSNSVITSNGKLVMGNNSTTGTYGIELNSTNQLKFSTANIGFAGTGDGTHSGNSGYVSSSKYNSGSGGTVSALTIYLPAVGGSPNNHARAAIYSDSSGAPGTLLSSATAATTTVTTGWNTLPLGTTVTLSANTTYWLAFKLDSDSTTFRYQTGVSGDSKYDSETYSSNFPSSFTTDVTGSAKYSVYAPYVTVTDQSYVKSALTLDANGGVTFRPNTNQDDDGYGGSTFNVQNAAGSNMLTVNSKGNYVGINNSLQVGDTNNNYNINVVGHNTSATARIYRDTATTTETILDLQSNVGSTGASKFSVLANGNTSIAGNVTALGTIQGGSTQQFTVGSTGNVSTTGTLSTGSSSQFQVDASGNVSTTGTLASGSSSQFQVNGSGNVSTTGTSNVATTSSTAFRVQKASGSDTILTADTSNNRVKIGNDTAASGSDVTLLVLDSATSSNVPTGLAGAMYYDSTNNKFKCYTTSWVDCDTTGAAGGSTRTVTLVPEYAGGILQADGSNNNGTMTSAYDSSNRHNYYSWTSTQGTLNDYTIVARTQIPSEYTSGFGTFKVWVYTGTTSTADNDIKVTVRDGSGTACVTSSSQISSSAGVWRQATITLSGCSYAANDVITVEIQVFAKSTASAEARVGEISYQYTN